MRIPEHLKLMTLEMGENGQLQLPPELAEALDFTPGCRLMLVANTEKGTVQLQRLYGFVPQVLGNDGISDEARQTVQEILAAVAEKENSE